MIVTIKEYCETHGHKASNGYVYRMLKAGKLLPGMKRAFKSGGTWMVELV